MDNKFKWTTFYSELATALLKYKNNRGELIEILKDIYAEAGMNFPFKEKEKKFMRIYVRLLFMVLSIKELPMQIVSRCSRNSQRNFQYQLRCQ